VEQKNKAVEQNSIPLLCKKISMEWNPKQVERNRKLEEWNPKQVEQNRKLEG
jgi:hypothetical protein